MWRMRGPSEVHAECVLASERRQVEAAWAMNSGFARFEAGHIYLDAPALCGHDSDLTTPESDSKACVMDVDERL